MVTVNYKLTLAAFVNTNLERHLLPMTARAAILTCISRRDFLKPAASIFSFALQDKKERAPSYVGDGLCERGILDHPFDVQVFHGDCVKLTDQFRRRFVVKMFARSGYFQVCQRDFLFGFLAVTRSAFFLAQASLLLRQVLRRVTNEARVFDLLAIRQRGEVSQANINADALTGGGQGFRLRQFTDQQGKPAICAPGNSQLHTSPFHRAAQSHAAEANTGNGQLVAFERAGSLRLIRLTERVVTITPLEAREAGFAITFFASFEKGFECFINAVKAIALNRSQVRFHFGQRASVRQVARLFILAQRLVGQLVATNSLFQCRVVDLARVFQFDFTRTDKFRVRANAIFKGFVSCGIFGVSHCVFCVTQNAVDQGRWVVSATHQPAQYTTKSHSKIQKPKQFGREREPLRSVQRCPRGLHSARSLNRSQGFTAVLGCGNFKELSRMIRRAWIIRLFLFDFTILERNLVP
jgi:hypothetical protein